MKLSLKLTSCVALLSALFLLSCSKSKDDFALDLAKDIVTTMNTGSDKKEPNILSEMTYKDSGKGLVVTKEGMGLFGMAFQNALRADGYTDGITLDGTVDFDGYNSAFGDLEGQQLQCDMMLHFPDKSQKIDYIVDHVKGRIDKDDEVPVEVDYKFRIDNPTESGQFDVSSLILMGGQIKQGDKIYKVDEKH